MRIIAALSLTTLLLCRSLIAEEECCTALDLATCLEIAMDTSPMTRAAQEGINIAISGVGIAKASTYPDIRGYAHYHRFEDHVFLPNGVVPPGQPSVAGPTDDYEYLFYGRYMLYDSGRTHAQLMAAAAKACQAEQQANQIYQELALKVTVAYYTLLARQELVSMSKVLLKSSQEHLRSAQERYEAEDVSRSSVLRLEIDVSEAEQALSRAEGEAAIASAKLNLAMGLPPECPICIVGHTCKPTLLAEECLCEALETALDTRPELLVAGQKLRILDQEICSAKSQLAPKVCAEGSFGYHDAVFPAKDKTWSLGVALDMPIFFGFTEPVNKARAERARAQAELDELALTIRQQVVEAFTNVNTAYRNIQTASTFLKNAQESLKIIEERYKVDASTTSELLDAQTTLAKAEASHVGALWNYCISWSTFLWSQGTLFAD